MFSPEYLITNKVLTNLIGVEVNAKLIEMAPLSPEWEFKLKKEVQCHRANGMLHFAGNGLDLNSISKIVSDEPNRDDRAGEVALRTGVVGKEKDIQALLNLLNTSRLVDQVSYLSNKFKHSDFGEKELMQINLLFGERLLEPALLGKYRSADLDSSLVDLSPSAIEVPYQVDDLFLWFKSANKGDIHPILKSATMFFELIRISPFANFNLETSLSFFELVLASEGYSHKQLLSVADELFKNKETFLKAMTKTEDGGDSLTPWFEFVTRAMLDASEKAKIKVMNLVGDAPIFKSDSGKVISLTDRQIVIMEEITIKNEMTIREIRSLLPLVSDDTILRDLKDLMGKKLIKKKGKTKGAMYLLGKVRGFR